MKKVQVFTLVLLMMFATSLVLSAQASGDDQQQNVQLHSDKSTDGKTSDMRPHLGSFLPEPVDCHDLPNQCEGGRNRING